MQLAQNQNVILRLQFYLISKNKFFGNKFQNQGFTISLFVPYLRYPEGGGDGGKQVNIYFEKNWRKMNLKDKNSDIFYEMIGNLQRSMKILKKYKITKKVQTMKIIF